jgi:hypothetical protein
LKTKCVASKALSKVALSHPNGNGYNSRSQFPSFDFLGARVGAGQAELKPEIVLRPLGGNLEGELE